MTKEVYMKYLFEEESPETACIAAIKAVFDGAPVSKLDIISEVRDSEGERFTPSFIEQVLNDLIRRKEVSVTDDGKYELTGAEDNE